MMTYLPDPLPLGIGEGKGVNPLILLTSIRDTYTIFSVWKYTFERSEMPDNKLDEYKEINNNVRFYGNMRFAQLTLFSAITAALLTIIFKTQPALTESIKTSLEIGGVVSTFVLWVMEERSTSYATKFIHRLQELEQSLGFNQWRGRRIGTRAGFSATNAVRLLYLTVILFWIFALIYKF